MIRSAPICFADSTPSRPDCAVTHHGDGRAWLDVGGVRREPPGPEHIRGGQQAGNQVVGWHVRCGDQRAVRQRYAKERRLRTRTGTPGARRTSDTRVAMRARVVRRGERPDDELALA